MAVPPQYGSTSDYLMDVLGFLKTYQWMYSAPNTRIFIDKVLDEFPVDWLTFLRNLSHEELNDLALGRVSGDAPDSLKSFFKKINDLKFMLSKKEFNEDFNIRKNSGLSRKKEHEIISLVPIIHDICQKSGCDFIIDVGTGLGYLPRLLYDKYRYRTLAIEGNPDTLKLAESTQKKYPESMNSIKYCQHFVTSDSRQYIQEAVNGTSMTSACITGLHACADLSVTVLKLFTELHFCKTMVIMPCCYHRLKENDNGFENFPASCLFNDLMEKCGARQFLRTPFLRLACQGVADRFSCLSAEEHEERTNGCLFRAVLEEVSVSENYQVRRLKRKSGKVKRGSPPEKPFETYLTNLKHTHFLIGGEITDHQFLAKMREKWTQHKGNAYLIEVLAAFQAVLQNICENVVLLDRVMFLKEKGIECFVVKVTDQGISPRCHALVAVKP